MFHGNISKLDNEELCLIVNLNNVDVPEAEFLWMLLVNFEQAI